MYQAEVDAAKNETPVTTHSRTVSGLSKAPGTSRSKGREIELDFLRGLAILMVLDYHAPVHWMSYPFFLLGFPNFGWAGVDIFFVLSGFLVGGLLIKEWRIQGGINSKRFLIRRGFKIWPQYYVFLGLLLLTGHRTVHELLGNLLNLQNYMGGVPHTWSLAVEEHAYLLLAFGLAWAARVQVRMRSLAAALAALCLLMVVGRLVLAEYGYEVVNRTHTRMEGILYGVLLAIAFHYRPALFRRLQGYRRLWMATLLVSLLYLRFQRDTPWASSLGWDAANLLGIALLMLLYGRQRDREPTRIYRWIAWIGVYSYGIYLWHVAVIAPSLALAGRLPTRIEFLAKAVLPVVAGIVLGAGFTKLVELPALRLRDRWFPRNVDSPVGRAAELERVEKVIAAQGASAGTAQVVSI